MERQDAAKDSVKTLYAFSNELNGMEGTVGDWGWWDDTYNFVENVNPGFIESNLDPSTFENLRVDYIVITRSDGTVVVARGYDRVAKKEIPVPDYLTSSLSQDSPLLPPGDEPVKVSGVLTGADGQLLVASTPVLTSNSEGPSPGYLVMARKLDSPELALLSRISGESLYLNLSRSAGTGSAASFALKPFTILSTTVNQSDPNLLSVESTIGATDGKPAFAVGMVFPRDAYRNAFSLVRDYFIIITVLMAVFAGIVILIIDHLVLGRLSTLIRRVQEGVKLGEGQRLPPMPGNDEFNKLDEVIGESQRHIYEAEAKFRQIVETAQEGICIVDRDLRLTYVNERFAQLSGFSVDELLGRSMFSLIAPGENADQDERNVNQAAGRSETYERRFIRKDGSEFFALVSATPVFMGPDFSGSFAMITDITGRKRAENALKLATRKLNVLRGTALNDLTNQLFTLQGYIELAAGISEGKAKEYALRQQEAAGRILNQIAYIRHFQDMGIQPPRWQNVNSVLLYAVSHLDMSHVRRTERLGRLEIYADPMLEKILYSLVENSLTHGRTVTEIRCYAVAGNDEVTIFYEDNGCGIPEDKKEKIFEPTYTEKGFPLSLVREILSITGISIRETGEYGKGVRFEIRVSSGFFRFAPETPQ